MDVPLLYTPVMKLPPLNGSVMDWPAVKRLSVAGLKEPPPAPGKVWEPLKVMMACVASTLPARTILPFVPPEAEPGVRTILPPGDEKPVPALRLMLPPDPSEPPLPPNKLNAPPLPSPPEAKPPAAIFTNAPVEFPFAKPALMTTLPPEALDPDPALPPLMETLPPANELLGNPVPPTI